MSRKAETPYPAPKIGLPWELKCKFARGQVTTLFKGFMHVIREKFGAAIALEIAEGVWKYKDRMKNMINTIKDVFKIEGNDIEAIINWWNIWFEHTGIEATWLEVTDKSARWKINVCPWNSPDPEDLSGWCEIFCNTIEKIINPKVIHERPVGMCSGDPYCEHITRIEE